MTYVRLLPVATNKLKDFTGECSLIWVIVDTESEDVFLGDQYDQSIRLEAGDKFPISGQSADELYVKVPTGGIVQVLAL